MLNKSAPIRREVQFLSPVPSPQNRKSQKVDFLTVPCPKSRKPNKMSDGDSRRSRSSSKILSQKMLQQQTTELSWNESGSVCGNGCFRTGEYVRGSPGVVSNLSTCCLYRVAVFGPQFQDPHFEAYAGKRWMHYKWRQLGAGQMENTLIKGKVTWPTAYVGNYCILQSKLATRS